MNYELWYSEAAGCYAFILKDDPQKEDLLEIDSKLIWTVEASSYEEAKKMQHEYLGWEEYRVID